MFMGHFGLAFGAKKAAPTVSLGTLFAACQFADLLWPTLLLLGYEHVEIQAGVTTMTPLNFVSYPYSHSLLALCLWGIAFGAIHFAIRRTRITAAVTIALLVVSHWLLDYVTHRPDMPLTLNGPQRLGLGLWNSVPGTLAAEFAIFAFLYWRIRKPHNTGSIIGLYLMLYATVRFTVEFFRNHEQGNLWGGPLDTSQWISLGLVMLGAWFFYRSRPSQPVTAPAR